MAKIQKSNQKMVLYFLEDFIDNEQQKGTVTVADNTRCSDTDSDADKETTNDDQSMLMSLVSF